jgi:hypothetical protein
VKEKIGLLCEKQDPSWNRARRARLNPTGVLERSLQVVEVASPGEREPERPIVAEYPVNLIEHRE